MATIETTTAPFAPSGTLSVTVPAIGQANLERAEVPTTAGVMNLSNSVTSSSVIAGGATITLTANKTDRYTGLQVNAFTVALGTPVSGMINTYIMTFATGATKPTINWPTANVTWLNGVAPTNANMGINKMYQVIFEVLESTKILASYGEY